MTMMMTTTMPLSSTKPNRSKRNQTKVMDDENESLKEMLGNSGSTLAGLQRVSVAAFLS